MNVTVEITPSQGLRDLLDRARTMPEQVLQGLGRALSASGPMIVGNAVKYRFTAERGPFPISDHKLGRRTGRLRQSITNTPPQINPSAGEVTMGFGSNVRYFGVHEFGFTGNVQVKAHQRKGRPVRGHSRYVKIAARAPMTTELMDPRTEEIVVENARRQITRVLNEMEGGPA